MLQQVFQIDGMNYPLTYNYTDSGCGCPGKDLHSVTYPDGRSTIYTRDNIGRVLSIFGYNPGGSNAYPIQSVSYNSASGAISAIGYYSASDTYSYDPTSGQLVGKTVANGSGHRTWSYHYTNAGRISEIEEGVRAWTGNVLASLKYDYSYDSEGRLGSMIRFHQDENENWIADLSAAYPYDRYGNMSTTPSADSNTNRILNYIYNSAGRLTSDGTSTYSYNALGLLTQVNAGQRGIYRYDALGRRVKKQWNYTDSSGQHYGSSIYVFGPDGNIMAEYTNEPSSSGCPSSVVDNVVMNGTIVSRWVTGTGEYCPYGAQPVLRNHLNQVLPSDLTDQSASPYSHPFGSGGSDQFPGQKDDLESSLKDFGARYYNPAMARWTSADSIMAHTYDPQSLNKYACVRNDPVNYVDPDGRFQLPAEVITGHLQREWQEDYVVDMYGSSWGSTGGGDGLSGANKDYFSYGNTFARLITGLANANLDKDNCKKFFDAIGIEQSWFKDQLTKVAGINPDGSQKLVGDYDPDSKYASRAIDKYFKEGSEDGGKILGWSPYSSNDIYLKRSALTMENIGHEIFHKYFDHGDTEIKMFLKAAGYKGMDESGTEMISTTFKKACL